MWKRIVGSTDNANRARRLKNRSLRLESLEDRALLSVTTGAPDAGIAYGDILPADLLLFDSNVSGYLARNGAWVAPVLAPYNGSSSTALVVGEHCGGGVSGGFEQSGARVDLLVRDIPQTLIVSSTLESYPSVSIEGAGGKYGLAVALPGNGALACGAGNMPWIMVGSGRSICDVASALIGRAPAVTVSGIKVADLGTADFGASIVGVVGPNGAGKSALLSALSRSGIAGDGKYLPESDAWFGSAVADTAALRVLYPNGSGGNLLAREGRVTIPVLNPVIAGANNNRGDIIHVESAVTVQAIDFAVEKGGKVLVANGIKDESSLTGDAVSYADGEKRYIISVARADSGSVCNLSGTIVGTDTKVGANIKTGDIIYFEPSAKAQAKGFTVGGKVFVLLGMDIAQTFIRAGGPGSRGTDLLLTPVETSGGYAVSCAGALGIHHIVTIADDLSASAPSYRYKYLFEVVVSAPSHDDISIGLATDIERLLESGVSAGKVSGIQSVIEARAAAVAASAPSHDGMKKELVLDLDHRLLESGVSAGKVSGIQSVIEAPASAVTASAPSRDDINIGLATGIDRLLESGVSAGKASGVLAALAERRAAVVAEATGVGTGEVARSLDADVVSAQSGFFPPVIFGSAADEARIEFKLSELVDYQSFLVDASSESVTLYGVSKDGVKTEIQSIVNAGDKRALVVVSGNTAHNVTFTAGAMTFLNTIVYDGGRVKNDIVTVEGSDFSDTFRVDRFVDSDGLLSAILGQGKVWPGRGMYDTITVSTDTLSSDAILGAGATMYLSGVRSVSLDAKDGNDVFAFGKFAGSIDVVGGQGDDAFDFTRASARVKVNMALTSFQAPILGVSGRMRVANNDVEMVLGTAYKDVIITAPNTIFVSGEGNDDTVRLNGRLDTYTRVLLEKGSQTVSATGCGRFDVAIADGSKSNVNMASLKNGAMSLYSIGDNIRVLGTKCADSVVIRGNNAYVRGNQGNDEIQVIGADAKVYGDAGNDLIDVVKTSGTNFLSAGTGADIVLTGKGMNRVVATSGRNIVVENGGENTIIGNKERNLQIEDKIDKGLSGLFMLSSGSEERDYRRYHEMLELWDQPGAELDEIIDYIAGKGVLAEAGVVASSLPGGAPKIIVRENIADEAAFDPFVPGGIASSAGTDSSYIDDGIDNRLDGYFVPVTVKRLR